MVMQYNREWFPFQTESYGWTKLVVDESFIHLKVLKIGLLCEAELVRTDILRVYHSSRKERSSVERVDRSRECCMRKR